MWQQFDDQRECKILGNVLVIKPKEINTIIPLFCPECEFPFKDITDIFSFQEFQCCSRCELYFVRPNMENWIKNNWRPDKQSTQWQNYIQKRKEIFRPTIRFK